MVSFRPSGMMTRAALAALDWNSNLLRDQVKIVTNPLGVTDLPGIMYLVLISQHTRQ